MDLQVGDIFCVHGLTYAGRSYGINDVLLFNVGIQPFASVVHEMGLETPRNYPRTKGGLLQVYRTLDGPYRHGFDRNADVWTGRYW